MSDTADEVIHGVTIPASHPEAAFLRHWATHLVDPNDPQNQRWFAIESSQIERGRRLCATFERWAPLAGARVLDVGCQTGALTIALAERGADAHGVDVSNALVEAARVRAACHADAMGTGRTAFSLAHAERLPFDGASFDFVAFVDVIEHVDDADAALSEVARVLRPNGVLWLQGPNRLSPRWLLRDPHYQMAGISVLPPALGRFYVTQVRRRPRYDVGVFPVGSRVVRALESRGLRVVSAPGPVALRFAGMFELVARKR